MCSMIVYFLHCICVCDCDSRHESLIMLSHSVMVRRSHMLARCYLGTMCMCTTAVRCSAIEGILHRYHSCGPILVLEEVAHNWHLGYLGALGLLGAIRYLGAIGLLSLHVDVWRLIFLKLSLPRDGVRGCSAPCNSILYVRSFFKNGTDLTVFVI
jgi:hypothetical protein